MRRDKIIRIWMWNLNFWNTTDMSKRSIKADFMDNQFGRFKPHIIYLNEINTADLPAISNFQTKCDLTTHFNTIYYYDDWSITHPVKGLILIENFIPKLAFTYLRPDQNDQGNEAIVEYIQKLGEYQEVLVLGDLNLKTNTRIRRNFERNGWRVGDYDGLRQTVLASRFAASRLKAIQEIKWAPSDHSAIYLEVELNKKVNMGIINRRKTVARLKEWLYNLYLNIGPTTRFRPVRDEPKNIQVNRVRCLRDLGENLTPNSKLMNTDKFWDYLNDLKTFGKKENFYQGILSLDTLNEFKQAFKGVGYNDSVFGRQTFSLIMKHAWKEVMHGMPQLDVSFRAKKSKMLDVNGLNYDMLREAFLSLNSLAQAGTIDFDPRKMFYKILEENLMELECKTFCLVKEGVEQSFASELTDFRLLVYEPSLITFTLQPLLSAYIKGITDYINKGPNLNDRGHYGGLSGLNTFSLIMDLIHDENYKLYNILIMLDIKRAYESLIPEKMAKWVLQLDDLDEGLQLFTIVLLDIHKRLNLNIQGVTIQKDMATIMGSNYAPVLFAFYMYLTFKNNSRLRRLVLPIPRVKFFLDDITIMAKSVQEIVMDLLDAEIGLKEEGFRVNLRKTKILGRNLTQVKQELEQNDMSHIQIFEDTTELLGIPLELDELDSTRIKKLNLMEHFRPRYNTKGKKFPAKLGIVMHHAYYISKFRYQVVPAAWKLRFPDWQAVYPSKGIKDLDRIMTKAQIAKEMLNQIQYIQLKIRENLIMTSFFPKDLPYLYLMVNFMSLPQCIAFVGLKVDGTLQDKANYTIEYFGPILWECLRHPKQNVEKINFLNRWRQKIQNNWTRIFDPDPYARGLTGVKLLKKVMAELIIENETVEDGIDFSYLMNTRKYSSHSFIWFLFSRTNKDREMAVRYVQGILLSFPKLAELAWDGRRKEILEELRNLRTMIQPFATSRSQGFNLAKRVIKGAALFHVRAREEKEQKILARKVIRARIALRQDQVTNLELIQADLEVRNAFERMRMTEYLLVVIDMMFINFSKEY